MYKELSIEGDVETLDRLFRQLSEQIGPGWSRDPRKEEQMERPTVPPLGRRYAFRSPGGSLVILERHNNRAVVNTVVPPGFRLQTPTQYNAILDEFVEKILRPSAERLDLVITITPDPLPSYWLGSPEAARLLEQFFAAEPLLGSDRARQPWFDFLIRQHRDGVTSASGPCRRYLAEGQGWPDEYSAEYASLYNFGLELLAAYDRSGGPADSRGH